jgi:hypothetical protein
LAAAPQLLLIQAVEFGQQRRPVVTQLLKQDLPRILERSARFVTKLTHEGEAVDSSAVLVSG